MFYFYNNNLMTVLLRNKTFKFIYCIKIAAEDEMEFSEKFVGDVLILKSSDDTANMSNAQIFKNTAIEKIQNGNLKLIVDLSEVPFVDSTFLGALVVANRKIVASGGRLVLMGTNEPIFTLLGLTKLDKTFVSYETIDEAVKSFEQ